MVVILVGAIACKMLHISSSCNILRELETFCINFNDFVD